MPEESLSFEELSNVVAGTEESNIAIDKNLEHPEIFRQKKIEELQKEKEILEQLTQEVPSHERKPR